MPQCKCCNTNLKEGDFIKCFMCETIFSYACVNLVSSETRLLRSKTNIKWTCNACSTSATTIATLMETINQLTLKVQQLSDSLLNIQSIPPHDNKEDIFEEVVSECMEREKRCMNTVFFGIPEDDSSSVIDQVTPIVSAIDQGTDKALKAFRLGKPRSDGKPRPIKVVHKCKENALRILKNGKKLKDHAIYSRVYVRSDKTPRQQEYERKIRSTLKTRTDNGETDLIIKYINSVPTISRKN